MTTPSTKAAIVTGGSRGIGAAISRRLAKDSFALVINYAGNKTEADKLVGEITSAGGKAIAMQANVADASAAKALFDAAEAEFGGVDVLVNNAGVLHTAPMADFDDAQFDRLFSINVKGTFNTLRLAATRVRSGGRIINLSTSVIGMALPGYSVYAATKAAVETFTAVLTRELRGKNITVNAVAPGPTATELFFEGKSEQTIAHMSKLAPLERLGHPEDIAGIVAFLAGPDGTWVNGQVLRANGGMV
jgi:3-oxoacyl-[acyl-carrier protein] reductase